MNLVKLSVLAVGLFAIVSPSHAEEVSLAKAAELGCHRVERLVTLKRIEDDFLNKFYAVRIKRLPSGPARFRFNGFQSTGAGGKSRQVEILMDETGKATTHAVIEGPAAVAPAWPQKDPVTLTETAFHYILDNPARPELVPFFSSFSESTLEQVSNGQGETVARVTFKSSATPKILEVLQKLDGTFVSATVR